jgi:hypothetical protein
VSVDERASSIEMFSSQTSCAFALLHAGRYAEAWEVITHALIFDDGASDVLAAYGSRVTFCIAVYRTVDTLLNLLEVGQPSDPALAVAGALEMARRTMRIAGEVTQLADGRLGLLGAALLELASERILINESPNSAMTDGLTQAVEDIREVGQRPWIIEANMIKSRALMATGSLEWASEALHVAEELAAADNMVLQGLICRIEREQLNVNGLAGGFDATTIPEIIASATRLGLAFIESRARHIQATP